MTKESLAIWTALAVIGALLVTVLPAKAYFQERQRQSQILEELDRTVAAMDPRQRETQSNLIKWYNREPENGEAYPAVLDLYRGCMGYLELEGQRLPIFHGEGSPVGHEMGSSLPNSGPGTHTVLHIRRPRVWRTGEVVYLGILGRQAYRVESVQVMPGLWTAERPPDEENPLLTLVWDGAATRTLVRCVAVPEGEAQAGLPWEKLGLLPRAFGAFCLIWTEILGIFRRILRKNLRKKDIL